MVTKRQHLVPMGTVTVDLTLSLELGPVESDWKVWTLLKAATRVLETSG